MFTDLYTSSSKVSNRSSTTSRVRVLTPSGLLQLLRVWASPPHQVQQLTRFIDSAGGYHGYWAQDLNSVNSNLGSADDLKSLVSTAHSKVGPI